MEARLHPDFDPPGPLHPAAHAAPPPAPSTPVSEAAPIAEAPSAPKAEEAPRPFDPPSSAGDEEGARWIFLVLGLLLVLALILQVARG